MNYEQTFHKILNKDEKIEYSFSIGQRYIKVCLVSWGIISILLLLLSGFFGILIFLITIFYYAFYLKTANVYIFTDKRVIIHQGWLSTKMISIDYQKITDILVDQRFLDKMIFKTGNLAINTAGTTTQEVVLKHLQNPYEIKKKLDILRDKKN